VLQALAERAQLLAALAVAALVPIGAGVLERRVKQREAATLPQAPAGVPQH